jgi:hypothetical protein
VRYEICDVGWWIARFSIDLTSHISQPKRGVKRSDDLILEKGEIER